jgi:hypothetical protein
MAKSYISHTRAESFSNFPEVIKYFNLQKYLQADTWKIIRWEIKKWQTNEAYNTDVVAVNNMINVIERSSLPKWYIVNRLRDQIALSILMWLIKADRGALSTLIQDICYGIDAILDVWDTSIAINVTENMESFYKRMAQKWEHSSISLPNQKWKYNNFPFALVWINKWLIDNVLWDAENFLRRPTQGYVPKLLHPYIQERVYAMLQHDTNPDWLLQIFTPNDSPVRNFLSLPPQIFWKSNPPPSR